MSENQTGIYIGGENLAMHRSGQILFSPMPCETKRIKQVELSFYFHSRDLYVGKSNWNIYRWERESGHA